MLKKIKTYTVVLLILLPFSTMSQEVITVNDLLSDTAFVSKLPLPMASVLTNAEQTEQIIESAKEILEVTPEDLTKVDSILSQLNDEFLQFKDQLTEEFLNTSNTIVLDNTMTSIKNVDNRVMGYIEIVQTRTQELEAENRKLIDLTTIWDVTLKSDRITELSGAIISRLNEVVKTLDATDIELKNSLNYLLELELKLNDLHLGFDNLHNLLSKARGETSKTFLIPDSDPIWIMYSEIRDSVNIRTRLNMHLLERKAELVDYYESYKGQIFFAILIIIIIQVLFLMVRYQILKEQIEDRKQLDNTVIRIFKVPFMAALLVGIFISWIILPEAPLIFNKLIYLIALLPFIFILMKVLVDINRFLIVVLFLVLLLSIVSSILFDFEILSRTLLLLINLVALSWILIVMRIHLKALDEHPLLRKGIHILLRISLIILILCFIGNIFGYYTITSLLLSGILATAFFGISMYFIDLLVNGFFVIIFNSPWGQQYRVIKKYQKNMILKIQRSLVFILTVIFILGTFQAFLILDDVYAWLGEFLKTPYNIGNFSFTTGDILLFLIILMITSWISRIIQFILQEQVLFKSRKKKDVSASISSLVKFAIITTGFIIAAMASGFPLDRLTLLLSAFGVGIGFGLQNIFNNLVSGIILVFEQPLQVGDTIEVGQLIGVVKSIGIRASTIRTFDGAEVIVPNGNLISNDLINWTLSDSQRRLIVKVGVEYGTDPNQVIKILLDVAKRKKELLEYPESYVLFKEFGDSALGFELRCYTESDNWLHILSDLHVDVNDALIKAGIVIPFPQRDLHIRSVDPYVVENVKSSPGTK